jgi:hypothetical protein
MRSTLARSKPAGSRSMRLVALSVILLATAACGTTVPGAEEAHRNALEGGELAVGSGEVAGSAGLTDGLEGTEAGAIVDGIVGGTGTAFAGGTPTSGGSAATGSSSGRAIGSGNAAGSGGSSSASGAAAGASAPGVTDKEIAVGAVYDKSAGSGNAAFGFAGIGQINGKRAYEAIVADLNARGGMAGRKIKLIFYEADSSEPGFSTETLQQALCSHFTKDNKIFAFFGTGTETLKTCFNKAGVVQIGSGAADSQELRKFPLVVQLQAALDRTVRFAVPRLKAMGYYSSGKEVPGFKIGVIRYDRPAFERAMGVMRTTLAENGFSVADEVAIRKAQSIPEVSDEFNAIRAAVLRFKSAGISHVQFIGDTSAFLPLIFMQNAEKQVYRPRYGLVSSDGGQALATLLGNDAQPQLSKSLLVGWFPLFDVRAQDYSGDKTTPAFRRCKELLEKAGERFGEGDPTRNKEAQASIFCDSGNYLKAAIDLGGRTVNPQSWLSGVAQVKNLDSASTFILTTSESRHDGVGGVKDDTWFDNCSCFRYTSDVFPV